MAAIAYPRAMSATSKSVIPLAECIPVDEELEKLLKEINTLKRQLKKQRLLLTSQKKSIEDNRQSRRKSLKMVAKALQKIKEYENIVKNLRTRINKSEAENKMLKKENFKRKDEISTDVAANSLLNFVKQATVLKNKIKDLSNEIINQKEEIQLLTNIISSIRNLLHQPKFRTYSKKVQN